MKKIFILISTIGFFVCCKKADIQNIKKVQTETVIDSSAIKKKEIILLLNEVDEWMKKGVTNELSSSKVNDKINPLMKEFELKLSKLNKKDSLYVQEYRIKQINKMIELQMNH